MQNSMEMLSFLGFGPKYFLGHTWSKNLNLFVRGKICYLDKFEYAELNGGVLCICFRLETPFPKNENCHFQLKFDTYSNSNTKNSVVMFTLFIF